MCLHVGPDQIVELASQILSRCVEERQEFWTDVCLDQPSGISVYRFAFPITGDLRANHGNHERDDGMGSVTVVDGLEGQTCYAPEADNVEASWIEGCSDVIVVRHGSATLARRGKSLRV